MWSRRKFLKSLLGIPAMARYSTFKYGAEKYGASADTYNLWTFAVAWDGLYSGLPDDFNNEATRMVDLTVSRGRDYLFKPGGNGFEHYQPGTAVGIFDNEDGRYDPYNSSSPLYAYLKPGKFVRILVQDGSAGTNYSVMRGKIVDIQPVNYGGKPHTRIVVKDGLQNLADRTVILGLQQNIAKYTALTYVLQGGATGTEWPTTEWPINTYGSPSMEATYTRWWAWKQNALDAIHQIIDAEFNAVFHDRAGNLASIGRDLAYLRTKAVGQDEVLRDISIPQPWEIVRNDIRSSAHPIVSEAGNYTVWKLNDVPSIGVGQTFQVEAQFRYLQFPAVPDGAGFTHTVNTNSDGSGTDLTASCPLTYNADIGTGAEITITNNSGQLGYITSLYVQTTIGVIYSPYTSVKVEQDSTSISDNGSRTMIVDSPWITEARYAENAAEWLLSLFKDPNPMPTVLVENRPDIQFYLDLYDQMVFTSAKLGLSSVKFRVGKVEHQWLKENGTSVRTLFKLEPYYNTQEGFWTFTTQIGTTSVLGF